MVCGGLPAFHRFHRLSSQILVVVCGDLRWFVVVCGGLWWFAVVCDGLRWFVMVCGGLSYSHTLDSPFYSAGPATTKALLLMTVDLVNGTLSKW